MKTSFQNYVLITFVFQHPLIVALISVECQNNQHECRKTVNFHEKSIFQWSKDIAIGDEVFHHFYESAGKREVFFRSFCEDLSISYRYPYKESAPFVSSHTFISCMMSWIINLNIDYRSLEAIDPYCCHEPEVLACDGVHVGVAKRFMRNLKDISKPEKPQVKDSRHRRFDRTLIRGKTPRISALRTYMKSFCEDILTSNRSKSRQTTTKKEPNQPFERNEGYEHLLLSEMSDYRCKLIFRHLFEKVYPYELAKCLSSLIIALNKQAALLNFLPFKDHTWLIEAFEGLKLQTISDSNRHDIMCKLEEFRVQFARIMATAHRHQRIEEVSNFFLYLIEETIKTHEFDNVDLPDNPSLVDKYDPASGIAYYFTPHGGQVRKTPNYSIEGKFVKFYAF